MGFVNYMMKRANHCISKEKMAKSYARSLGHFLAYCCRVCENDRPATGQDIGAYLAVAVYKREMLVTYLEYLTDVKNYSSQGCMAIITIINRAMIFMTKG